MGQLLLLLQLLLAHLMVALLLLVLDDLLWHLGQAGGRTRGHASVCVRTTPSHVSTLASMMMISGSRSLNFDNVGMSRTIGTTLADWKDLLRSCGIRGRRWQSRTCRRRCIVLHGHVRLHHHLGWVLRGGLGRERLIRPSSIRLHSLQRLFALENSTSSWCILA